MAGVIRDQRTMLGTTIFSTVAEVMAWYDAFGQSSGWYNSGTGRRVPGVVADHTSTTVDAFVNASRWVAGCPDCGGGLACWPDNPHAVCADCGHKFTVSFPSPTLIAQAEAVLSARTQDGQRNWNCHRGETITDLKAENLREGVPLTNQGA